MYVGEQENRVLPAHYLNEQNLMGKRSPRDCLHRQVRKQETDGQITGLSWCCPLMQQYTEGVCPCFSQLTVTQHD